LTRLKIDVDPGGSEGAPPTPEGIDTYRHLIDGLMIMINFQIKIVNSAHIFRSPSKSCGIIFPEIIQKGGIGLRVGSHNVKMTPRG